MVVACRVYCRADCLQCRQGDGNHRSARLARPRSWLLSRCRPVLAWSSSGRSSLPSRMATPGSHTFAQGIHQVDHLRRGLLPRLIDLLAASLLLDQLPQGAFVMVFESFRMEVPCFSGHDV